MSLKKMVGRMKLIKKKKVSSTPKPKKVHEKQARWLVLGGIVFVIFCSVFAFLRSNGASKQAKRLEMDFQTYVQAQQEKEHVSKQEPEMDIFRLNRFVQQFVRVYTVVTADEKQRENRLKELATYTSPQVVFPENEYQGVARAFKQASVIGVVKHDGYYTVQVALSYTLINPKLTTREVDGKREDVVEEEKIDLENYLMIDVVEENGLYTVVSLPYFESAESLKGSFLGFEKNVTKEEVKDIETVQSLETFLNLFFDKYALGSPDLQYVMSDVESLEGRFEYQDIQQFKVYKGESIENGVRYQVHALVAFRDKDSDFKHYESFVLTVDQQEERYVVTKINRFEKETSEQ